MRRRRRRRTRNKKKEGKRRGRTTSMRWRRWRKREGGGAGGRGEKHRRNNQPMKSKSAAPCTKEKHKVHDVVGDVAYVVGDGVHEHSSVHVHDVVRGVAPTHEQLVDNIKRKPLSKQSERKEP